MDRIVHRGRVDKALRPMYTISKGLSLFCRFEKKEREQILCLELLQDQDAAVCHNPLVSCRHLGEYKRVSFRIASESC
jgi:hypothetical protein